MKHLPEVRAAIVKALPEQLAREYIDAEGVRQYRHQRNDMPRLSLAHVLQAMELANPKNKYHVRTSGHIGVISPVSPMTHVYAQWNLVDDLDHQSEETIAFLHSILCV